MSVSHALMGVRAGADDVLIKPVGAQQVISRVERGAVDKPLPKAATLEEVEWEHISRVLHEHQGNISHAAESLGIYRQSLQRKIQKYAPRVLAPDDSLPYPLGRLVEPSPEPEPAPTPKPPPKPAPKPRAKKRNRRRHH
jgi:hypothetical protein